MSPMRQIALSNLRNSTILFRTWIQIVNVWMLVMTSSSFSVSLFPLFLSSPAILLLLFFSSFLFLLLRFLFCNLFWMPTSFSCALLSRDIYVNLIRYFCEPNFVRNTLNTFHLIRNITFKVRNTLNRYKLPPRTSSSFSTQDSWPRALRWPDSNSIPGRWNFRTHP